MNEVVTREQRRKELETTNFARSAQGGALMQPTNGRELMDMANMMAQSGQMVRDFYRGNPGDCAALIMICQPYGFNPFMVSWKTYKASKNADAPISFEGQLVNAMVNQSAPVKGRLKYDYEGEGEARTCTVTGIDRETGEKIVYTTPPIGKIPVKNSPLWKADPDQQLAYYAARSWARRHFPELLLGVYTREEIEEAPMRDVTPAPGGFAQKAVEARKAAAEVDAPAETPEAAPAPAESVEDAVPSEDFSEKYAFRLSDLDLRNAYEDSEDFEQGYEDYTKDIPMWECPHTHNATKATDWCAGWVKAQKEDRS